MNHPSLFPGKFRIVPAANHAVWIGADNNDNCAVKQVITDGQMKDWSFKDDCLVLSDVFYSSHEGDKVVVRFGTSDCTKWEFVSEREETYRIRLAGTNQDWTACPENPNTPVILVPTNQVEPYRQLFRFIAE